jgi:hypothetical protein
MCMLLLLLLLQADCCSGQPQVFTSTKMHAS